MFIRGSISIKIYFYYSISWALVMIADKMNHLFQHHLRFIDWPGYLGNDLIILMILLFLLTVYAWDCLKIFISGIIVLMVYDLFNLCNPLFFIYSITPVMLKDSNEAFAWCEAKHILLVFTLLGLGIKVFILKGAVGDWKKMSNLEIPQDLQTFIESFEPKHFQIGESFIDFFDLKEYAFFQNQYVKKSSFIERLFSPTKTELKRYFFGQLPDSSPIYYENDGDSTGIYYKQHGSDNTEKIADDIVKLVKILNYIKQLHSFDNNKALSDITAIDNTINGVFWLDLFNDGLGKHIIIGNGV